MNNLKIPLLVQENSNSRSAKKIDEYLTSQLQDNKQLFKMKEFEILSI